MEKRINLKELAIKELTLSPLMADREKVETEDIIGKTLTIIGIDMVTTRNRRDNEDKTYPVCVFEELPDKFYFGGFLLKKLAQIWANEFDGDFEELSAYLAETGGVKIRFKGKAKNGNTNTFDIL